MNVSQLGEFWRQYRIPIVLGISSIVLIMLSIVLLFKSTQTTTPIRFSQDELGSDAISTPSAVIDIEGAVVYPGIKSLPVNSRVEDAIRAAGGLNSDADREYVAQKLNRAMKLTDGMKLYIPKTGEGETSHNIVAGFNPAGAVSINTASQTELEALAGIGVVTAKKIIDGRPYASLDDLVTKKAIGPSLLEKLRNQLSL